MYSENFNSRNIIKPGTRSGHLSGKSTEYSRLDTTVKKNHNF